MLLYGYFSIVWYLPSIFRLKTVDSADLSHLKKSTRCPLAWASLTLCTIYIHPWSVPPVGAYSNNVVIRFVDELQAACLLALYFGWWFHRCKPNCVVPSTDGSRCLPLIVALCFVPVRVAIALTGRLWTKLGNGSVVFTQVTGHFKDCWLQFAALTATVTAEWRHRHS